MVENVVFILVIKFIWERREFMKKSRVVIIGCGAVAYRWYFKGLMNSKECEIVALVDSDPNKLNDALKYCEISEGFRSCESFFSSSIQADIALILTPHHSHYEIIKECFLQGLNVYSEKPFAENYKESLELIQLASQKNLVFCSAPQIMLSSRNQKAKELVEKGIIGNVVMVRASGSNMGPADRPGIDYDPEWFYQDGGSISSLGIYTLAIVLFIWGTPKRVAGLSGISIPNRTVAYGPFKDKKFTVIAPDNEVALLDFNNMYVLFDGSYCVKNPLPYELIIHGTKGTLYVGGFGGKESIALEKNGEKIPVGPEDDCHIRWNLSMGVDEMANAIRENRTPKTNAEFASQTILIIESIRESNKTNKIIDIIDVRNKLKTEEVLYVK